MNGADLHVTPGAGLDDSCLASIAETLKARFTVGHCTIQLEHGDEAHPCAQEPVDTV